MHPGCNIEQVYLCREPIDFRKSINGLSVLVAASGKRACWSRLVAKDCRTTVSGKSAGCRIEFEPAGRD